MKIEAVLSVDKWTCEFDYDVVCDPVEISVVIIVQVGNSTVLICEQGGVSVFNPPVRSETTVRITAFYLTHGKHRQANRSQHHGRFPRVCRPRLFPPANSVG